MKNRIYIREGKTIKNEAASHILGKREQINEIKELGGCDGSGISRMHAGAILSCTLVIRQPQLITRASNICAGTNGEGGKTALYIQTYCNLSCFALMPDYVVPRFDELFLRS